MGMRIVKALGYGDELSPSQLAQWRDDEADNSKIESEMREFWVWARHNCLDAMKLAHDRLGAKPCWPAYVIQFYWWLGGDDNFDDDPMSPFGSVSDTIRINGRFLILASPELSNRWFRHDDSIDFYEDAQHSAPKKNRVAWLGSKIYPYEQGSPPIVLAALCLYFGTPEVYACLDEVLCTYWA